MPACSSPFSCKKFSSLNAKYTRANRPRFNRFFFFLKAPSDDDAKTINGILSSLGNIHQLDNESDLDLVTAISGSGPAYVFEFTCASEEAAKKIGLDPGLSKRLAIQTVIGSAKLMECSLFSPEELRIWRLPQWYDTSRTRKFFIRPVKRYNRASCDICL